MSNKVKFDITTPVNFLLKIAKWMSSGWERERGSGQRRQLPQTIGVSCQRVSTLRKAIAIFDVHVDHPRPSWVENRR